MKKQYKIERSIRKRGFTLIELLIVIAIIAILSAILLPKIQYSIDKARRTGVEKNKQTLTSLATNYYEKAFDISTTNEDRVTQTYNKLIRIDDINKLQSPIDNTKVGLGLIIGNTFTDLGNAAYIFSETPDVSTIPNDVVYIVLKDRDIVSNIGEDSLEKPPLPLKSRYSTSGLSSAYIGNDNNLYTWGYNNYGELGIGNSTQQNSPKKVTLPNSAKPVDAGSGFTFTAVLDSKNNIYTCGATGGGRLGNGVNSWYGIYTFSKVNLPATFKPTDIEVGSAFVYSMSDSKEVYVWGENSSGQLGLGDTTARSTPTKLTLPTGVAPAAFYAGYYHVVMITDNGDLYACGSNSGGILGIGTTTVTSQNTFVKVELPNSVKAVSAALGHHSTLVLGDDGNVYACGSNRYYELGNGTTMDSPSFVKVSMPLGVKATSVACGETHGAFTGDDGYLYTWGDNGGGKLATGNTMSKYTPYKVTVPNGEKAIFVHTHFGLTTLIVTDQNNTYICGYNSSGQLGLGHTSNRTSLTKINLP